MVMKISSTLLKPNLMQIESGFLRILHQLGPQTSQEAGDLKDSIEKQLRQGHKVKTLLLSIENNPEDSLFYELFEDFKKMKLCLRFAERRWKLILSNEARNRKMRERLEHVAPFVA